MEQRISSKTRFIRPSCLLVLLLLLCGGDFETADASVYSQGVETPRRIVATASDRIDTVKLIGTALSANPAECVAIFADASGTRQWLLREGDQIGPLTIKRILLDRVIVDSAKGNTELKLRRNIIRGSVASRSNSQYASLTPKPIRSGPRFSQYVIDREALAAVSTRPDYVQETIAVKPGKLFNQDKGFRITEMEPDSIFPKMGLRTGDLVLSANNSEVSKIEDIAAIVDTIQAENNVDLRVRRRARTYHLYVKIQ